MPESLWAQFGIAGASVFALWASVKSLVARLDRADERHTEERREWREDARLSQERSDAVVEKLTEAIKELRDKR